MGSSFPFNRWYRFGDWFSYFIEIILMGVNMQFLAIFFLFLIGFISPLSSMNTRTIGQEVTERDLCHKVLDCLTFVDGNRRQRMGAENTSWVPFNRVRPSHGIISA